MPGIRIATSQKLYNGRDLRVDEDGKEEIKATKPLRRVGCQSGYIQRSHAYSKIERGVKKWGSS